MVGNVAIKCYCDLVLRERQVDSQAGRKGRWKLWGQEWKITDSHHYLAPVLPVVEQINKVRLAWPCSGTSSTQPLITAYTFITHRSVRTLKLRRTHTTAGARTHAHAHFTLADKPVCYCFSLSVFSACCPHITHLSKHLFCFLPLKCYWVWFNQGFNTFE